MRLPRANAGEHAVTAAHAVGVVPVWLAALIGVPLGEPGETSGPSGRLSLDGIDVAPAPDMPHVGRDSPLRLTYRITVREPASSAYTSPSGAGATAPESLLARVLAAAAVLAAGVGPTDAAAGGLRIAPDSVRAVLSPEAGGQQREWAARLIFDAFLDVRAVAPWAAE